MYLERIEVLRQRIFTEKDIIKDLCEKLENPCNIDRWRPLEGEDLSIN